MIEWTQPGKASVLVGGSFGSEGKALAAGWLASKQPIGPIHIATTAAGANSGHTLMLRPNVKFVNYHLPTTGVIRSDCRIFVNAGAIIDIDVLGQEIRDCGIDPSRVSVHPRAAVITDEHRASERAVNAPTTKLASTQHGVGAALADKIWRRSPLIQGVNCPAWLRVERLDLNDYLMAEYSVVIETPQGTGLGINHGFHFPSCTSRDCIVSTAMDYAGVHPSFLGPVAMVIRAYPIRVGAIFNEFNEKVGDSGPFYPDSVELVWGRDLPNVAPEYTTVTKRLRRIATFSYLQYRDALKLNRPDVVLLNFANYLPSGLALASMLRRMVDEERQLGLCPFHAFGFGPFIDDVVESTDEAIAWYDRKTAA